MNNTKHRVLIVEDNAAEAARLEAQLQDWGYLPLMPAATAQDAILRAGSDHPALVLMDIQLRDGSSGVDAARRIRQNGGQMPIVFLTAHSDQYLDAAGQIGFFAFIGKPADDRIIKETVRVAIEHFTYTQQIAEASAAKIALARATSHDLSNLMQILRGFQRMMITALEDASSLARTVLDADYPLNKRVIDVNRLIAGCVPMLRARLNHGIALTFKPEAAQPTVEASDVMLRRLLFNVVINAQAHGFQSGADMSRDAIIKITTHPGINKDVGRVAAEVNEDHHWVSIAIEDNGCGINSVELGSLKRHEFPAGERLHGHGLANVNEIVEQHHGKWDIESTEGVGTRITISLPHRIGVVPRDQTVLYIDDDPMLTELYRDILERAPREIITAQSSQEAMALFEAHKDDINVVVTDLHLGKDDGRVLAANILAKKHDVEVVYTSGVHPGDPFLKEGENFVAKDVKALNDLLTKLANKGKGGLGD